MARSSTSPFPTPSQPPSRCSTRLRTPVNLNTNSISQDSRHSFSTSNDHNPGSDVQSCASSVLRQAGSSQLSQAGKRKQSQKRPPSKETSVKQKSKTRKRNKRTPAASNDESHLITIDIVQDSGEENSKPHVTHHQETMTDYLKKKPFEIKVFNQLLVMWLVRFSLPWSRIEDFILWVAFNYVRRGVDLYTRIWAATEAHRLYMNLQDKVVTTLQDLNSKFTLIHDVWTTKGNRHAFMGISVAYITADWKFVICHLGMKYIASNHKGKLLALPFANIISKFKLEKKIAQTTDSGSNNFTMATEVDRLILKKTGVVLNLTDNHIRCICHKIALILNAGLHALQISGDDLLESPKATLGFIPGLSTVDEESKEMEPSDTYVIEDVELGNNPMEADNFENEENTPEQLINNPTFQGRQSINGILKKVDFIIQRITSSSSKRFEYTTWSKNLEINGPSLIAGYGIRWNIKFQSRERGYKGRMVIAKLFELERERQKVEGGPNYYSNLDITSTEWEVVNHLNETLSEFYFLTKKMEGDYSSGSMILSEYHQVEDFLNTKLATTDDSEFQAMLRRMLTKTNTYLQEALACDAILIATALNPCFRLSIYQAWFPDYYTYTSNLLQILFDTKKAEVNATKEPTPAPRHKKSDRSKQGLNHKFDFFPDAVEEPVADELTTYLGGIYKLDSDSVSESLDWWKEHSQEFPILALLAKDYLACCATSASVERCFSAAADTCSSDRGSLAAKTIERCVSSHQWLAQGIEPDGDFETAQQIITLANKQREKEKAKKAEIEVSTE
ncbi:hypothetical protein MJO28_005477 [Puccinia striiformis f. sp. tritici]|uniref:Uncharacterized protein n=1 Tax=Puccinia striiformis f. sp. tritici TaxID=168172 RepID=A0ACC0EM13_9BASI|nr:hypothetical protein MJO28_005477 [Puccinia striiformis f. sp. tritici]